MEDRAEDLVKLFNLHITGAKVDDVLIGTKPVTRGSIIKIHGSDVYPTKSKISVVKSNSTYFSMYKIKLKSLEYDEEYIEKLISSAENDSYIRSRVEFISIGSIGEKIGPENALLLMQPNSNSDDGYWSLIEVESMFPKKAGSKAEHHTLVLHKDFWQINCVYEIVEKYDGNIIDVSTSSINEIYVVNNIIGLKDYGFKVDKEKEQHNLAEIYEEYEIPVKTISFFNDIMRRLPPSAYKSFIQKIIRYRALFVGFDDGLYNPVHLLILAVGHLMMCPGSFVPDIQRFVSGIESCTKRLAIISVEDSYISINKTYKLLCFALLSQKTKWKPGKRTVKFIIDVSVELYDNKIYYEYDHERGIKLKPIEFNTNDPDEKKCSALLDTIKSFESDVGMMRDIAYGNSTIVESLLPSGTVMKFEHFVDQHWVPNMVFHYEHEINDIMTSKPFANFFKDLWKNSSSFNSRKSAEEPDGKFQNVQKKTLISLQRDHISVGKKIKQKFSTDYILHKSWLSALVGIIEIEISSQCYYCTLGTDDIYTINVTRRPSRNMKEDHIDEETIEKVRKKAKEHLKKGTKLNDKISPVEKLKNGAKLLLIDGKYIIKDSKGDEYIWEELLDIFVRVDMVESNNFDEFKILYEIPTGISENWNRDIHKLLKHTENKVMQRIIMYLSGYKSVIEINGVSRDGGSKHHQVTLLDQKVYTFFLILSNMFPFAIKPAEYKLGTFISETPPLLWRLRDYLIERIKCESPENKWLISSDKMNRKLYAHQEYVLSKMKSNKNRGNFIWLKVGMGKTLIVLLYIKWLQENDMLPKYIIYTLPKSALKTVISEIKNFGLSINLYIPTKSYDDSFKNLGVSIKNGNCIPEPYTITMITSDNHLRLYQDKLLGIISESLFIIDEVHKALNESQRTSAALQLSNLSNKFIAFTGTPVIDQHTYKLIWWLEQIVPYVVNNDNFWVSANSMISKFADTNIQIERKEILAKIINEENYYSLVGPSLGGKNNNVSMQNIKDAFVLSSNSCNIEIVDQAIELINGGVVIVANDIKHQEKLRDMLCSKIESKYVHLMKNTIDLPSNDTSQIKIVIVPINKPEGYNLTKMSTMITGVYPSNQATRTQIEGRINRIGQLADKIMYITVHCGILTRILKEHSDAKSLGTALELISSSQ
jgi:hypothetical protein